MTNKDILFKAKRMDNGEWVEGNLILSDDAEEGYEAIIIPTTDSNMYTKGGARGTVSFENWHRVNKDTICRYTGLTDTDGNKIWENDIMIFRHEKYEVNDENFLGYTKYYSRNYVIEFINTFCTYGFRFRNKSIHFPCKKSTICMHNCVVIGNIFDNPELLK